MIHVLIVDDDPFIRESLKIILELDPDIAVAGACADAEEGCAFVQSHGAVDVVLMDIRMPGIGGVEGARRMKEADPSPAVLMLTTFDDDEYIAEAIRGGASGYLLKNVPPARIVSGIKTVHEGAMLVHPDVARKLAGMLPSGRAAQPGGGAQPVKDLSAFGLTAAEQQIVRHIADGQSNKEIAASLFLSEGTVKNYISEILAKLELRDRTQLAIFYLKLP